jgi:hypothetical protein
MPGDGGMARPRRGTRVPLLLRLAPGIGGRKRGAGEDMIAACLEQVLSLNNLVDCQSLVLARGLESELHTRQQDRPTMRTGCHRVWGVADVSAGWVFG